MAKKKEQKKYNNVLGIDLGGSTRNGLALYSIDNHQLVDYVTVSRRDSKSNLAHRKNIINEINNLHDKYNIDILLFESIRLFSYGRIQLPTILSLNKVQTTIINEFSEIFDIYQVDVRAWKSRVLSNGNADKFESITFVKHKYPNVNLLDEIVKPIKKEIVFEINHDIADAICISHCLNIDYSILQEKNKMNFK